ncbi:MAG TPA: glycoside hydrolase family 36 protein [Candidatus Saccharimonadales bacterium]|nr:glycoside hydrolase family 36 protein [Candidatus Saccharimonadales bacterium]
MDATAQPNIQTITKAKLQTRQLTLTVENGLLTIRHTRTGKAVLWDCQAQVQLSDGRVFRTEGATVTVKGRTLTLETPSTISRPRLTWTVAVEDNDRLTFDLKLSSQPNSPPFQIARLDALYAPHGFQDRSLESLKISQTGWQSWHVATPPVLPDMDLVTRQHPNAPASHVFPLPQSDELRMVLADMTLLRHDEDALLLGFVRAKDAFGMITLQPEREGHSLSASNYLDGIALYAGNTLKAEPLLLLWGREDDAALDEYAAVLAETMQARVPSGPVPTGWCSWYYYYDKITEQALMDNVRKLAAEKDSIPIDYILLDDGYMTQVGDWTSINDKFPSGMKHIVREIQAAGFKPGIWIAPFIVSSESEVYRQHPEWVIAEKALVVQPDYRGMNYFLDLTRPDVQEHIRSVIRTYVEDWGFEYLKIDFLYAAAIPARRYDPSYTSIQAYRKGMEIIREAAGDVPLLGCGAPMTASIGIVDQMRVGPDTAPYWRHPEEHNGTQPSLRNAMCSTLGRGWMQGRLWVNDPDVLMVRSVGAEKPATATSESVLDWINDPSLSRDDAHDTQLTEDEVRAGASVIALSGGTMLISEDVTKLSPEKLAVIPRLIPASGVAAKPLPHSHTRGKADLMKLELPGKDWMLAAFFNWSTAPLTSLFIAEDWGLAAAGPYHLYDTWTNAYVGQVVEASEALTISGHGVQLLAVRPDLGRPQVVGSSLHLLGGMLETSEQWQGNILTITIDCPGKRSGMVSVFVPAGYTPASGTAKDNILQVPVDFIDRTEIRLTFQSA